MKKEKKIKIGIPTRFLLLPTLTIFRAAGYNLEVDEKTFQVKIDDPEIECFPGRTREIAERVGDGILDAGISRKDRVLASGVKVREICDLDYNRTETWEKGKIVLVVPKTSKIKTLKDLNGKTIITRFPEITKKFLKRHKVSAKIETSDTPNEFQIGKLVDAGVEFTLTGSTLAANNLKPLAVLMETSAIFIANEKSLKDKWKREKIENLAILLKGARLAQEMAGLMLHASNKMMEEVLEILPALKKPTVTQLRGENWFDVLTVANKKEIRKIIPRLKKIGCTDIIEFPLNKVVI
ncbi:ATP phosphoribosyltransferase [Patescibacteria group bacterium]|nr:ATP phosphoribosyltransferase [Patescibacteria group bacterium]